MIKYATATVWAFASCFFLWFFTYVSAWPSSPDKSPYLVGLDDLFTSFLLFTLVVTLGGASYYVLSKIIEAPYNQSERASWIKLMLFLKATLAVEFVVLLALVYIRDVYIGMHGGLIFMAVFFTVWLVALFMMRHAVQQMRCIRVFERSEINRLT